MLEDAGDGKYTITLDLGYDFRFKIYTSNGESWYGSECLTEENEVPFETDDHTNIALKSGRYLVTFDSSTKTITLEN